MWSFLKTREPASKINTNLMHRLFDQSIIQNQFLKEYVKELVLYSLRNYRWRLVDGGSKNWDLEHADGCCLKVACSSACQLRPTGFAGGQSPIFCIGQRPGAGSDANRRADLYLFAWNPVPHLRQADHRNPQQWQFFVMPDNLLPLKQKTISLRPLQKIATHQGVEEILYSALAGTVEGYRLRLRAEGALKANGPVASALAADLVAAR